MYEHGVDVCPDRSHPSTTALPRSCMQMEPSTKRKRPLPEWKGRLAEASSSLSAEILSSGSGLGNSPRSTETSRFVLVSFVSDSVLCSFPLTCALVNFDRALVAFHPGGRYSFFALTSIFPAASLPSVGLASAKRHAPSAPHMSVSRISTQLKKAPFHTSIANWCGPDGGIGSDACPLSFCFSDGACSTTLSRRVYV